MVVFNSAYNRATFLEGTRDLLKRMPDHSPKKLHHLLAERSVVLAVPLHETGRRARQNQVNPGCPVLLWNHRWEHDKGPEILLHALRALSAREQGFSLVLCGQRFRDTPPALATICSEFADRIQHNGYLETDADYHHCMDSADFVLSTALQEFQGLAVLQAVQHGCIPLVPDRLCYPEFYPETNRYAPAGGDPVIEGCRLADHLCNMLETRSMQAPLLEHLVWKQMAPMYHEIMTAAATRREK